MLKNTILQPMPSPRNTNHEGLYILRGKRGNPQAAYDSAFGLENKSQQDADEPVQKICEWVKNNLSPGQIQAIVAALSEMSNGSTMDSDDPMPPDFPGMPRAGGGREPIKGASDARNARLRQADVEARNAQSFFARYPQAGRLRERF